MVTWLHESLLDLWNMSLCMATPSNVHSSTLALFHYSTMWLFRNIFHSYEQSYPQYSTAYYISTHSTVQPTTLIPTVHPHTLCMELTVYWECNIHHRQEAQVLCKHILHRQSCLSDSIYLAAVPLGNRDTCLLQIIRISRPKYTWLNNHLSLQWLCAVQPLAASICWLLDAH